MRSDRELLELAAKAAGMAAGEYCEPNHEPALWHADYGFWQPLTHDGDALRLAVKLALIPTQDKMLRLAWVNDHAGEVVGQAPYEECDLCEYAATRRAIIRAAAEIGAKMQEG